MALPQMPWMRVIWPSASNTGLEVAAPFAGTVGMLVDGAVVVAIAHAYEVLALFAALLRMSAVEEGSLREAFGPIDLSGLIGDLGEALAPLVEDSHRLMQVECQSGLQIVGDRELLAQAVIHLVDHARRHTPEGTQIHLCAAREGHAAVIGVADNRPGIPGAERERVSSGWNRPVRAPAMAWGSRWCAIARAHGAGLTLSDARPGLAARIRSPV